MGFDLKYGVVYGCIQLLVTRHNNNLRQNFVDIDNNNDDNNNDKNIDTEYDHDNNKKSKNNYNNKKNLDNRIIEDRDDSILYFLTCWIECNDISISVYKYIDDLPIFKLIYRCDKYGYIYYVFVYTYL